MDAFWWLRESAFDRGMSLFYPQDEERAILSETIKKGILLSQRFDLSNLPSFLPSFPIVAKNALLGIPHFLCPHLSHFFHATPAYSSERRIKRKSVDTIEITRWIAHLIFNNSSRGYSIEDKYAWTILNPRMKLREDRGNFSNLVSLRVLASLENNSFYPNSFMQLLQQLSLSLSPYPRYPLFEATRYWLNRCTSYKRYFRKVNTGEGWVLHGRYTNSGQYLFPRAYSQKTSRIRHLWCFGTNDSSIISRRW